MKDASQLQIGQDPGRAADQPAGTADDDGEQPAIAAKDLPTASANDEDVAGSINSPVAAPVRCMRRLMGTCRASATSCGSCTTCQLDCQEAAEDDLLAFPPYAIHAGVLSCEAWRPLLKN